MQIDTKYFGPIQIEKNKIITFESGIPGFPHEKKFALLPLEGTPFSILQSILTVQVAFVVTDPFLHFPSYEFKLVDEVQQKLQIESEKDVIIFTILTLAKPFANSTANLKAPIVINERTKLAKQMILPEEKYETKHMLFQPKTSAEKEA